MAKGRFMRYAHEKRWLACAAVRIATILPVLSASTIFAQTILLENATVIPVSTKPIKKGGVLIKDGKIVKVAASIEAPFDAQVIDCTGKTIFPGMIDPHTWRGMDVPNESPPVTAFVNVYDAIDPSQLFFEDSLRDGVTSIHVIPGNDCVIGDRKSVV